MTVTDHPKALTGLTILAAAQGVGAVLVVFSMVVTVLISEFGRVSGTQALQLLSLAVMVAGVAGLALLARGIAPAGLAVATLVVTVVSLLHTAAWLFIVDKTALSWVFRVGGPLLTLLERSLLLALMVQVGFARQSWVLPATIATAIVLLVRTVLALGTSFIFQALGVGSLGAKVFMLGRGFVGLVAAGGVLAVMLGARAAVAAEAPPQR